jgi:hypothetical protein
METLNLSGSTPREEGRIKSLLWPTIRSGADVDYLAVQGFWICTFLAVTSFAFLAMGGLIVTAFVVAIMMHFGGIGVREHSPFAASLVLGFYMLDTLASVKSLPGPGSLVFRTIFTALLLSNLRATWIAAKWKPESEEAALPPRMSGTFMDKFSDVWPAWIWPKARIIYFIFAFVILVLTASGIVLMFLRVAH